MKLMMRFGDQLVEVEVPEYATDAWTRGQSALTYYPHHPDDDEVTEHCLLLERHQPDPDRRTGEADPPKPPEAS